MNDDHIIRVIIQGYNKLSGVLKDAADQSMPHLDKLNDRLNRNKRTTGEYESAWAKMSRTVERGATEFDVAAIKAERLGNRLRELTRRTKENNEETKRGRDLLQQAIDKKNKLFEGLSPLDDVVRGFQKGRQRPEGDTAAGRAQLQLQQRLADLRKQEADQLARVNREAEQNRKNATAAIQRETNAIRDNLLAEDKKLDKMRSELEEASKITAIRKRSELSEKLANVSGNKDEARKRKEDIKVAAATEAAVRERIEKDEIRNIERSRTQLHEKAMSQIKEEERSRISSVNAVATKSRNEVRQSFTEARQVARQEFNTSKDNLPNVIRKSEQEARASINNIDSFVERSAARIGKATGDISSGFRGARKGLKEFEGEAGKAQSLASRIGAGFGEATRNINKFVNVRWNLIIGALQTIGTLVVEVGANLISLASSAVFAAGALGAAFAAAAAQAIPVIGLLAATFQELQNAIKVVQLRQKANDAASVDAAAQAKAQKSAVQQLADAHYALKQAQQGVIDADQGIVDAHQRVTDAIRAQQDAQTGLVKARQDAARAIVDAATSEKDAELSLRDANLSVLEAKQKLKEFEDQQRNNQSSLKDARAAVQEAQQRLAAAKAEGDAAQVSAAQGQLAVANQNVGSIQDQIANTADEHKRLVLTVDQSIENQRKARIDRARAIHDNSVRQRQGIAGSPEVKAALDQQRSANLQYADAVRGVAAAERQRQDAEHNVAQAVRGIANAQDAVTAASDKMSAAQRNAQREFNKLSEPEKNFVRAAERLVQAWKKLVRPLTDIITNAVTRLIDNVIKILHDPQIQSALRELAVQIGRGIDQFGKFLSDPETRRQLVTFITEAAKNMPTIVNLFLRLLHIVMDIAEAGAPIFSALLGGADSLLGRAERWARPREARTAPRDPRLARLEPVGQTTPGATTKEKSPLENFLTIAGKNLESWLKLIGAITRFFTYLFGGAQPSGNSLVGMLTDAFNKWADWLRDHPAKVHKFFEDMRIQLGRIAHILGGLAKAFVTAFSSKSAQGYTEFILTVVVPALLIMLGVIQKVTSFLVALTKIPVVGGALKGFLTFTIAASLLVKLYPVLKVFPDTIKAIGKAFVYTIGFMNRFIIVAREVGIAEALLALPFTAWLVVIGLVVLGIILLLRHFHLLHPAIKLLERVFTGTFDLIVKTAKSFANNIISFFKDIINWLRGNFWNLLRAAALGPFGLLLAAINKFLPGLGNSIKNGFKSALSGLGNIVSNALGSVVSSFKKLPSRIGDALKGLGTKLKNFFSGIHIHVKTRFGIPTGFKITTGNDGPDTPGGGGNFSNAELRAVGGEAGSGGRRGGSQGTDTVPAWLTPGEWVLNKAQQLRIARHLGTTVDATRMLLFGSHGASPTNTVSGNTVSEHGRWTGYHNFDVHTAVDDSGVPVNFIRFKDGTWGQITGRAANRIAATQGSWTPGYARRASKLHGGLFETRRLASISRGLRSDAFDRRFALGGVVSAMAAGSSVGPTTYSPAGSRGGNVVNQNFNVNSQGDSDWNGIMRIGAIHAQESY